MTLMFSWFWLLKIALLLATSFAAYKTVKMKSKVWGCIALILVIFSIVSPIKMDTNTRAQTNEANESIRKSKVLPERITDNSFKQDVSNVTGISENDLK